MDMFTLEDAIVVTLTVAVTAILLTLSSHLVDHDRRWRQRGRMLRRLVHPQG